MKRTNAIPGALDEALDGIDGEGTAEVQRDGGRAEVEVEDVDRLGVRVKRVRVERDEDWDIGERADALPDQVRALPERVRAEEVAPELGGAILRTDPEEYDGERYFEVEVDQRGAEVRRVRVDKDDDGHRARNADDWTMTREQLGRLLDELDS